MNRLRREGDTIFEKERKIERSIVCEYVCVWEREKRERESVCVSERVRERD